MEVAPILPISELVVSKEAPPETWGPNLALEIAKIEACDPCVADSCKVFVPTEDTREAETVIIRFNILVPKPARWKNKSIQSTEPIELFYIGEPGLDAPQIYSARSDFPRNLAHLNPVNRGFPASICIARSGISTLYERGGIPIVIDTIADWLGDAASDNLETKEWEPVPRGNNSFVLRLALDEAQRLAYKKSKKSSTIIHGFGRLSFQARQGKQKTIHCTVEKLGVNVSNSLSKPIEQKNDGHRIIITGTPIILLASHRERIDRTRDCTDIVDTRSFYELAKDLEVGDKLNDYLQISLKNVTKSPLSVCAIFAIWRPLPLLATIPGASHGEGSNCELVAFAIFIEKEKGRHIIREVYPLSVSSTYSRETIAAVTGVDPVDKRLPIIGCGALGSHIAVNIGGTGIKAMTLVDGDIFQDHNIPRHVLSADSIGFNKASELAEFIRARLPQGSVCKAVPDIWEPKKGATDLDKLGHNIKIILDTTASRTFHRKAALALQNMQVIRAYLADSGRVGVLMSETVEKNPTLFDIETWLYTLALTNAFVRRWLNTNAEGNEIDTGIGCSSATSRLDGATIAAHAALMSRVIPDLLSGHKSGILLSYFSDSLGSISSEWIDVPEFIKLPLDDETKKLTGWKISLSSEASAAIRESYSETGNESGGYLYGKLDEYLQRIVVTQAIHACAVDASPTHLVLNPAGKTSEERELVEATNDQIYLVGAWHTHPNGVSKPSDKDIAQFRKIADANVYTPRPLGMVISGKDNITGTLVIPNTKKRECQ